MKTTKNFSYFLEKFFQKYLVGELGTSSHTIRSYRDTFLLLMEFAKDKYKLSPEKIKLETLSKTFILDFLDWLEDTKGNAISTRNVRLASLCVLSFAFSRMRTLSILTYGIPILE